MHSQLKNVKSIPIKSRPITLEEQAASIAKLAAVSGGATVKRLYSPGNLTEMGMKGALIVVPPEDPNKERYCFFRVSETDANVIVFKNYEVKNKDYPQLEWHDINKAVTLDLSKIPADQHESEILRYMVTSHTMDEESVNFTVEFNDELLFNQVLLDAVEVARDTYQEASLGTETPLVPRAERLKQLREANAAKTKKEKKRKSEEHWDMIYEQLEYKIRAINTEWKYANSL